MKKIVIWLKFDRIMVMSLFPVFGPPCIIAIVIIDTQPSPKWSW